VSGIYLASQSPRRKEILESLEVNFEVFPISYNEDLPRDDESPIDYVERNTKDKILTASASLQTSNLEIKPILTADTIVNLDGKIYGKPQNEDHGISMLMELSGQYHSVITCIVIGQFKNKESEEVNLVINSLETQVLMRSLSANECKRYWHTGEPKDKAGGYAIQGKGSSFVEKINGSFSNVVGLPILETCQLLDRTNIDYWLTK
jgi:septum formation protein|tara:strand:+ start:1569 stop:2186 length:618 start_codon:yes stop_codon:yes gene_type:complete